MLVTLEKVIAPNVNSGDQVLILTDHNHDSAVWQPVATSVTLHGGHPTVAVFPPRTADYYDPPEAVGEAMKHVDLNILLASSAMYRTKAAHEAMAAGVPCLCMDGGLTSELLVRGAATADYELVMWIEYAIYELVFKGASTV